MIIQCEMCGEKIRLKKTNKRRFCKSCGRKRNLDNARNYYKRLYAPMPVLVQQSAYDLWCEDHEALAWATNSWFHPQNKF